MPQIGWFELLVIIIVAILVIGPKDFPIVLKKIGSWVGSIKRYFSDVQKNVNEITNLEETYKPFGTLRRGDYITVLIKQTNKKIPGEFLGRLVLGLEDGQVKVFGATIY